MKISAFLPLLLASLVTATIAEAKPAEPFVNPQLADSAYAITHTRGTDYTPLAGPVGPSKRLDENEIIWKPLGPVNGYAPVYSGKYANGKRVMWVGGYDRVAKLDADTMEVLAIYATGSPQYFGNDEIERHIATMDSLGDKELVDYGLKLWDTPIKSLESFYHLVSADNEFYESFRGPDGSILLKVFGDADPNDPASKIELRREFRVPPEISKSSLYGMNMTSDGWVVIVTSDGSIIVVSKDMSQFQSLKLPSNKVESANQDFFAAFVRNGLTLDDHNGIYVVTRDNMHRVQWTGKKLSMDAADGGWSVPYPNELGLGSGTTPGLMGWGPDEDHLVVIGDGSRNNNMVAFWRDEIPEDWQGIPGYDRRIAGITPIKFDVSDDEQIQTEIAPVIYGYGAFFDNSYAVKRLPPQDAPWKQWWAEALSMHIPGHESLGGTVIRWDPEERVLKTAWRNQTNFVSTVCTISGATEILYCWGARNREWTLEGTDWHTGESVFHYTLGKSHRYNPMGGLIIIAPDGSVDCGCSGGLGIVRVKPAHN